MIPTLALLATLAGANLELQAGARNENSAGLVPTGSTSTVASNSVEVFDFVLIPRLGLALTTRTHELSIAYQPRFLQRVFFEQGEASNDPLVLHQFEAAHRWRITRTLTTDLQLGAATGELDYAGAGLLFGAGVGDAVPGALPGAASGAGDNIIRYDSYGGSLRVGHRLAAAWTTAYEFTGSHTLPDDSLRAVGGGPPTFPELLELGSQARLTNHFKRADDLIAQIDADLIRYEHLPSFKILAPRVGWTRRWAQAETTATAGVAIVWIEEGTKLFPIANVSAVISVMRGRGAQLGATLGGGLEIFPNPALATMDPRAFISAGLDLRVGRRWSLGADAAFYTVTTFQPRVVPEALFGSAAALSDTVVTASTPVTYRFSPEFAIEAGLRMTTRAPHVKADDFRFSQLEFVGFIAFDADVSTLLL